MSDDRPLIGVVLVQDGREAVHYYCAEEDALADISASGPGNALALAGAWSDLDWGETERALDTIRHQSLPT